MTRISLGPNPFRKKMFKELQSKKYHNDLTIVCSDGNVQANKLVLAAQSKFLKTLLLGHMEAEMSEIVLPEMRVKYVERVIKFMYSGKLTVTNEELYKNYLVWNVKEIIQNVFRLDANIDLGALNLSPPPDDWEDPDPGPSDSGAGGGSGGGTSTSGLKGGYTSAGGSQHNGGGQSETTFNQDGSGFRQNTMFIPRDETVSEMCQQDDAPTSEDRSEPTAGTPRARRESTGSDIIEVEVPPRHEPDIIDLLDSDGEQEEAGSLTEETGDNATIVMDNAEDDTETPWRRSMDNDNDEVTWGDSEPESDRDKGNGSKNVESNQVNNVDGNDLGNGIKKIVLPSVNKKKKGSPLKSKVKPFPSKLKRKKRGPPKKSKVNAPLSVGEIKKESDAIPDQHPLPLPDQQRPPSVLTEMPQNAEIMITNVGERPTIEPGKVVYRGKIVSPDEIDKKPKSFSSGVRKYNPNAFTITGLKKVESLIAVKEEKSVHACTFCTAKFEVYKSLVVHIQRSHKVKKAECPECGKKLSHHGAIKKHLLTHRPESEWPFECPLCHKKFQARADIPKHLQSNVHKNDRHTLPPIGTPEWFNLLYPERKGNCYDLIEKTEKMRDKEKEKLVNLPAGCGVTVEEYDQYQEGCLELANGGGGGAGSGSGGGGSGGRKRKAEDDNFAGPRIVSVDHSMSAYSTTTSMSGYSTTTSRSQRTAAHNAMRIMNSIQEDGAL